MIFFDYKGVAIELSQKVWEDHIQVNHPECDLDSNALTLLSPDEVWESHHRADVALYYRRKKVMVSEKIRYWVVVVKSVGAAQFISTAMIKSTVSGKKLLFKK